MKASQLIQHISQLIENHGDLEVYNLLSTAEGTKDIGFHFEYEENYPIPSDGEAEYIDECFLIQTYN